MTSASRCRRSGRAWPFALAAWLASSPLRAEERSQVELAALLESGELLERAGTPAPREPVWAHAAGRGSGRENLLRLGVSRVDEGVLPKVSSAAQLRLELAPEAATTAASLRDLSSFVGVGVALGAGRRLELRAFPFDTDYLRVGWLHALDWGGTDRARRESVFVEQSGGAPGVALVWQLPRLRLSAAAKWASVTELGKGSRRLWGALGGGSVDAARDLRIDAGFGYFQRPSREKKSGFVEGGSLRVVWHRGPREPELAAEPLRPAPLRDEATSFTADATPGVAVALELVTLVYRQRRFEAPAAQVLSAAPAVGFSASWRGPVLQLHAAATWRSLPFVVRDDTRVEADATSARGAKQAELAAWLGGSLTAPFGLVSALELSLELPAAMQTKSALAGYAQTFVVGGPAGLEPLPVGSARLPVAAARASWRQPVSRTVTAALWLDYVRDPNLTELRASVSGVVRGFAPADHLQGGGGLQARF